MPFVFDDSVDLDGLLVALSNENDLDDVGLDARNLFLHLGLLRSETGATFDPADNPGPTVTAEVHLLMSQSCNIDCVYCFNGDASYDKNGRSTFRVADALSLITKLRETHPSEVPLKIHFFGGEPMLAWREVVAIVKETSKANWNCSYHVTSNLTILPDAVIDAFKGVDVVFDVTIDGDDQVHNLTRLISRSQGPTRGTFEAVAGNVGRLAKNGILVAAKMVLSKSKQDRIVDTLMLHRRLGASFSSIAMLRDADSDGNAIDLLPDPATVRLQMEEAADAYCRGQIEFDPASNIDKMIETGQRVNQYCGGGVEHSSVADNKGNLYSCAWFVGDEAQITGRYGPGGIAYDLLTDATFREAASIDNNGGCSGCAYRYVCGGPCPATRMKRPNAMGFAAFEAERRVKCAVTKPILDALLWRNVLAEASTEKEDSRCQ